ncbi:preprotein translocase subunit SecE, partial [bacterium]|nr:preprotein translocase subunit SecE [bacterium]
VSWPTRQEILKYTLIVIVTVLLAGMFLGVTDFLFTTFLNKFIL